MVYRGLIFRRRKKDPLKALMRALIASKTAINRLNAIEARVSSRREYLLQTAIKLEDMGRDYLAKKYIEEAKRLENIATRLSYIKLVLEKLSMTIELHIELRRFNEDLSGVLEVVEMLKKLPESTIPEFSLTIHEIESSNREAIENAGYDIGYTSIAPVTVSGEEAARLLEEAKAIAKQKLLGELEAG